MELMRRGLVLVFKKERPSSSQDMRFFHDCEVAFHKPFILVDPAISPQSPIHPMFHPGTPVLVPNCHAIGNHAEAIIKSVHH